MDRRTIKLIFGAVCVLFNLTVLLSGLWLVVACVPGIGVGNASATVAGIGKITGLNGHAVGTFIGASMSILSLMYTHKVYREAMATEDPRKHPLDIVRHHSPLL